MGGKKGRKEKRDTHAKGKNFITGVWPAINFASVLDRNVNNFKTSLDIKVQLFLVTHLKPLKCESYIEIRVGN